MTLTVSPPIGAPFWRFWLPQPPRLAWPLGQISPDFALRDVTQQRTVRLANWRGKQPVVLVFYRVVADVVYRPERYAYLGDLNRAYSQFRDIGAEVLVVTHTVERQGQTMVEDLGLTLPLLSDPSGSAFRAYCTGQGLGAPLPAQFVLDAQGRLRYGHLCSLLHPHASLDTLLGVLERL